MVASPSCSRCSAPEEDVIHCLRDCPNSRELWMRAGALSWPGFLQNGCAAWVRSQVQGRNGSRFLSCVWGIWKWRNNMIFEEEPWTVDVAWRPLCYEHDEIKKVLSGEDEPEDGNWMARRWQPPPAGAFNLCVDGSYNPAGKFMGSGGLIRNHQGHWVCRFHSFHTGGSVLLAEARALKLGLQIAWEQGIKYLICNVDCGDLVRALQDEDTRQLFPILSEINEIKHRGWKVAINVISRDCNQPADWLARKGASSTSMNLCLLEAPPSDLEILILRDRLAIT